MNTKSLALSVVGVIIIAGALFIVFRTSGPTPGAAVRPEAAEAGAPGKKRRNNYSPSRVSTAAGLESAQPGTEREPSGGKRAEAFPDGGRSSDVEGEDKEATDGPKEIPLDSAGRPYGKGPITEENQNEEADRKETKEPTAPEGEKAPTPEKKPPLPAEYTTRKARPPTTTEQLKTIKTNYRRMEKPEIPEGLKTIFDFEKEHAFKARLKAVHHLGAGKLSSPEFEALAWFLHKKIEDDHLKLLQINAMKNDIVQVLIGQDLRVGDLSRHLVAMYYDRECDSCWRDYCLQFIGAIYGKNLADELNPVFLATLNDALTEYESGIAGTALLALTSLAERPEVGTGRVSEEAWQMAVRPESSEPSRITAIQICGRLKNKKILPYVRELFESKTDVPLRAAAIAAVGLLGDQDDADRIEPLIKSGDYRIRTAAKAAVGRLRKQ